MQLGVQQDSDGDDDKDQKKGEKTEILIFSLFPQIISKTVYFILFFRLN